MKTLRFFSIIIFFFFLDSSSSIVDSDLLASDTTSLLALRLAVGGRLLLRWNISDEIPCNWTGVTCQSNRVVQLRLPGMSLSGKLPTALGNLTELRTLSLRFNEFYGSIPAEIGNLANLRNLYLQGNLFSGEIPEFLFNLQSLVRLNLGDNNFSGSISPKFNKLRRLATLRLDRNQLYGSIPDLNLGYLDEFNVSFNKLTGSIPELMLSRYTVNSFEGNSLCGKPLLLLCNVSTPIGDNDNHHKLYGGGAIVVGIVMGCFVGCLCRKKRVKQGGGVKDASEDLKLSELSMEDGGGLAADVYSDDGQVDATTGGSGAKNLALRAAKINGMSNVLEFDLEDLLRASAEVLGKGTVGTTYKASLEMGATMAVKRLKDFDFTEEIFVEMVEAIENINHENLFPLRAYYYSKDERLLVRDYMPMGSLYAFLHGVGKRGASRTPLNWDTRISIALGAARGIAHLHSLGPSTSHGNIKSSNVLLTSTLEARVSDYGIAQLTGRALVASNRFNGYRAPEMIFTNQVSHKADVYSYGVLFLELLTGKDPNESRYEDEGLNLPRWMLSAVNDEWTSEVFDVEILQYGNVEEEVLLQLLKLAFSCTAQVYYNRPSMAEVISRIEMLCSSSSQVDEADVTVKEDESS